MNVDKFGHHVHKRLRLSEPIDPNILSKVLIQSSLGEYDLKRNRLKGLVLPLTSDEAVCKEYVDQNNKLLCKKKDILNELNSIKSNLQIIQKQLQDKCSRVEVSSIVKDHIIEVRDIISRSK